jgi:hypothetical protein
MGFSLSSYIHSYQIRAECTPILHSPYAHDENKIYWHKCTLRMSGPGHRHMTFSYSTPDKDSAYFIHEIGPKGGLVQVWKSRVSTYEVLYDLACEAALYEIAKRRATVFQPDDPSRDAQLWLKAAWLKPKPPSDYDPECWAKIAYRDSPRPSPEELVAMYRKTERIVKKLRVFLGGRPESLPPAYRILLSEVDEVAGFVHNQIDGIVCNE